MAEPAFAKRRPRAPIWADLCILLLGTWGFLRQCLKSLLRQAEGPHEVESDQ
jgi:hypothetical protein